MHSGLSATIVLTNIPEPVARAFVFAGMGRKSRRGKAAEPEQTAQSAIAGSVCFNDLPESHSFWTMASPGADLPTVQRKHQVLLDTIQGALGFDGFADTERYAGCQNYVDALGGALEVAASCRDVVPSDWRFGQ